MFLILSFLFIAVLSSVVLIAYANNYWAEFFGLLLAFIAGMMGVGLVFLALEWTAAEHKSRILNAEYGTNYTQQDVFWASDVIDTIREIDRKRIEVNGDLMQSDSGHWSER